MGFEKLGLSEPLLRAIGDSGYTAPTPIQEQAIPVILSGRDVIGSAQTGTGKTAAFSLPMLHRLGRRGDKVRALILEPTRELADQVDENLRCYGKYVDLRALMICGGVAYGPQLNALRNGVDIIAATPGRLLDHIGQGAIDLSGIEILILDEVDRMLDMGFIEDVSRIIRVCPKSRQTLLFSATLPGAIQYLARWALRDPIEVFVAPEGTVADKVDHAIYPVDGIQKYDLLLAMLQTLDFSSVLIFTRTKRDADRIAEWLTAHNHAVATLHADRSQRERSEALEGFKSGKYSVLVATDIASRGLDISGITHVINYNVPMHAEDYLHRIGRTGRADREGEAVTLLASDELPYLRAIERYIGQPIERRKLEGFPYRNEPVLDTAPQRKRRNRGFASSSTGFPRRGR